jgi:signal transduction histidine kinase
MSVRAISLRAQLLVAFVFVIVGTTGGFTYDAYRTNLAKLEAEARKDAAAAANARAQALQRMLANRQRRAEGVLAGARELCGETSTPERIAWAPDCMQPMLNAFRAAEGATGALITYQDRLVVASGAEVPQALPGRDALARITWISGRPAYVMRAAKDGLVMLVQYGSGEVAAIFRDASSLGSRGEAFLIDANGRFLTAARYAPGAGAIEATAARMRIVTPPGARDVEPVAACRAAAGEVLDIDYRGIQTLHAYQPVPALEGACVDAHVNWDEVLQPAEDLRDRLLTRGLLFILAGALYSLVASHGIAAPVQRLARAARGLRSRLDEPIPVDGPSEVQALGVALREASADLAALVGREQSARREAQAANRAKDRFLAAVTHELRTPLTAILGWTHIVRAQKPRDTALDRGLDAIERNAQTQHRLIEDLLDVSRIVTGRLRIDRQAVLLADVVDRALDAIRPQAEEKQISVQALIESATLAVAGDPVRLEQVALNLIANAVKFSRPGGTVLVAATRSGDDVELSVRDDGEGIVEEALPHVFDWFWQGEVPPGRQSSGLGLGLGIVRQLVDSHGGSVRAESDGPGFGSRFVVTLPLLSPAEIGNAPLESNAQRQII